MTHEERQKAFYWSWRVVFYFLFAVFFLWPELSSYRIHGFEPAASHPPEGLETVLRPWRNPLIRFFFIALLVSFPLERSRRYRPPGKGRIP